MLTEEDVVNLIGETTIKSCSLDPVPAIIMKKCYMTLVPLFRRIISLFLSLGAMPEDLKIAILSALLKKSNIDFESLPILDRFQASNFYLNSSKKVFRGS